MIEQTTKANHINCVPLCQILFWAIRLHNFISFLPNPHETDVIISLQDEDAKDRSIHKLKWNAKIYSNIPKEGRDQRNKKQRGQTEQII